MTATTVATFDPAAWLVSVGPRFATTQQLAHALSEHADVNGHLTMATSYMSVVSGLNRKEATLALRELRKDGFLVLVASERSRPNTYRLAIPTRALGMRLDFINATR